MRPPTSVVSPSGRRNCGAQLLDRHVDAVQDHRRFCGLLVVVPLLAFLTGRFAVEEMDLLARPIRADHRAPEVDHGRLGAGPDLRGNLQHRPALGIADDRLIANARADDRDRADDCRSAVGRGDVHRLPAEATDRAGVAFDLVRHFPECLAIDAAVLAGLARKQVIKLLHVQEQPEGTHGHQWHFRSGRADLFQQLFGLLVRRPGSG